MAFTLPKEMQSGSFQNYRPTNNALPSDPSPSPPAGERAPLEPSHRCGLCATTDAAEYAACERQICFSEPIPLTAASAGFTAPKELVSAYELAARYTAAAHRLDWEDDEKRGRYLMRARELRRGDVAEVPDEEIN